MLVGQKKIIGLVFFVCFFICLFSIILLPLNQEKYLSGLPPRFFPWENMGALQSISRSYLSILILVLEDTCLHNPSQFTHLEQT